jgi:hypothetical protein
MKVIIAGTRLIVDPGFVERAMQLAEARGIVPTEVVSGGARGVDALGASWAQARDIPVAPFPVTGEEWVRIGKRAGHLRNQRMADYADALVAVWDGYSTGTADMIERAAKRGLQTFVFDPFKAA